MLAAEWFLQIFLLQKCDLEINLYLTGKFACKSCFPIAHTTQHKDTFTYTSVLSSETIKNLKTDIPNNVMYLAYKFKKHFRNMKFFIRSSNSMHTINHWLYLCGAFLFVSSRMIPTNILLQRCDLEINLYLTGKFACKSCFTVAHTIQRKDTFAYTSVLSSVTIKDL